MPNEIEAKKNEMEQSMEATLNTAASIIMRSYLDRLDEFEIAVPSEEDLDIDATRCGQFFKLKKLVYNKEENFLDKLTTIVNVAFSICSSIATIIRSNGQSIDYYIGIISKQYRAENELNLQFRSASAKAFQGAITGNLTGSELEILDIEAISKLQSEIFEPNGRAIAAISGIAALRDGDAKSIETYVQGIENLADSLKGMSYTILLIADPVSSDEIQMMKRGYELIYSNLATFLKSSITLNESDTYSLSKSQTEGISKGITQGISLSQSKTKSRGSSKSINGSIGFTLGVPGTGINGNIGMGSTNSKGEAEQHGSSKSRGESSTRSQSSTDTTSTGMTQGKSYQLSYENRSIKTLLDKINIHLERLELCESFGAFDCAAYVITDSRETTLTVASNYHALMRGEQSFVQAAHISSWYKKGETGTLLQYLNSFVHPRFLDSRTSQTAQELKMTPASILSGKEIAIQIGLPKKSINGISVIPMAPFGRNVITHPESRVIKLGSLYHMGVTEQAEIALDVNSLASHTFITGSTGAGKSNTVYRILSEVEKHQVKFLIIEPAKGEYKHIFVNRKDVNIFGTNDTIAPLLRMNPFVFPEGIHVLEHIDRLVEIFNVCWPMYAAMPAVLKEAVEDAYVTCGWDLDSSDNLYGSCFYPTFEDVMASLNKVITNSAYSEELKSNYKGSLLTRVKSLTNGLNGRIFCGSEIDMKTLFDENTIIDLSRVGSMETKAMIMGVLVMRLQEYRMTQGGMNSELKHITVLEEAHHLLKRTSTEQSSEGSNLLGKAVEMLSNSIAEMRTFGEGFMIADQSPGLLDISVIRNTNTKIILRIPEYSDRDLVGLASGLNKEQIIELAKLPVGVAAVYQNNWLEPVLCKVDRYEADSASYQYIPKPQAFKEEGKRFREELLKLLLKNRFTEPVEADIDWLIREYETSSLSTGNKIKVKFLLEEYRKKQELSLWKKKNFAELSSFVTDLLNCRVLVQNTCKTIQDLTDLTETLKRIVTAELSITSEEFINNISHCFMKDYSLESKEKLETYYEWHNQIEQGIRR